MMRWSVQREAIGIAWRLGFDWSGDEMICVYIPHQAGHDVLITQERHTF
jgi:hypothetical protein